MKLLVEFTSADSHLQDFRDRAMRRLASLGLNGILGHGVCVMRPRNEFDVRKEALVRGLERYVRHARPVSIVADVGRLSCFGTNALYLPVASIALQDQLERVHDYLRASRIDIGALECAIPSINLVEGLTAETFPGAWEILSTESYPRRVRLSSFLVREETGHEVYHLPLAA